MCRTPIGVKPCQRARGRIDKSWAFSVKKQRKISAVVGFARSSGGRQKIASAISITHLIIESPRVEQRGHRSGGDGGGEKGKNREMRPTNAGTRRDRKRNATQFRLNSTVRFYTYFLPPVCTYIRTYVYRIVEARRPLQTRPCTSRSPRLPTYPISFREISAEGNQMIRDRLRADSFFLLRPIRWQVTRAC